VSYQYLFSFSQQKKKSILIILLMVQPKIKTYIVSKKTKKNKNNRIMKKPYQILNKHLKTKQK
jgi:hypothetical protein